MGLAKLLFVSTAIGVTAVVAPVAFSAGRFFGLSEQKKNIANAVKETTIGNFKYQSSPTKWSELHGTGK